MPPQSQRSDRNPKEKTVLLAVFDILGFSNRVRETSLSEVLDTYNMLRERTVKRYELWSLDLLKIDNVRAPAILRLHVDSVVYSDSVLAWVPMKRGFTSPFLRWCCEFVCEGLDINVPIRGAIAAGNAVLETDSNTFLGTPIVEAHELEANQDWIGLAFSHSAMWPPLIADITPELLMEYKVPIKEGVAEPISPDWPRIWRSHHNDECPSAKLRGLANAQRPKFRKYYLNAAQFAEHSCNNSNWYNEPQPEDALLKMRPYEEVIDEVRRSEAKRS